MANNIYSILAAYFRYQRDIGVDSLIFEHGSAVKTILSGAVKANAGGVAAGAGNVGGYSRGGASKQASSQTSTYTPPKSAGGYGYGSGGGNDVSPLSKLSKIRPVDTLKPVKSRSAASALPPPKVNSVKREKLAELYREVINCDKCALAQKRINKVLFGSGSADGKLFVIGGIPPAQDAAAGLPFQGEAGELFGKILGKMGLDRGENVFSTYLQKCFGGDDSTDGNQDGIDKECAGVCRSILDRQIDIIEPKVLLIFGQSSANLLLGNDDDIEQLRSIEHKYKNIPAIVTYELSLMLRETQYRHGAWDDMKKIINIIAK